MPARSVRAGDGGRRYGRVEPEPARRAPSCRENVPGGAARRRCPTAVGDRAAAGGRRAGARPADGGAGGQRPRASRSAPAARVPAAWPGQRGRAPGAGGVGAAPFTGYRELSLLDTCSHCSRSVTGGGRARPRCGAGRRGRCQRCCGSGLDRAAPGRVAPIRWLGDHPALRHRDARDPRLRPPRGGQGRDLPVRAHGAVRAARRARPLGGQLRRAAPVAEVARLRRHLHPQRHRHRRQDPAQGRPSRAAPGTTSPTRCGASSTRPTTPSTSTRRPTSPLATGHVPEMLELIGRLVTRGHAYAAEDGSGDVYFDVRSWPAYGELTGQRIDDMEAAEDADPRGEARPARLRALEGLEEGRPSPRPPPGRPRGGRGARGGTSSARRWR